MTSATLHRIARAISATVLSWTVVSVCAEFAGAEPDAVLTTWRAERRSALRVTAADKTGDAFRLLVVPVDFADRRLPPDWNATDELAPRLAGLDGETLERYFSAASGTPGWMRIVLSPLVRLEGEAADYSDLYLSGLTRTRALALQSLAAADAAGVPFATADADGDGRVDGVLVLHAAPGLENDPENGRIVPLQYYLEAPYFQDGIAAQHYAVASLHSGPGIWAHETAHLLGLEDRYDRYLSPAADSAVSRGGLGIFSLMSAGAWGRGDGTGAALLDAYSALQLGWVEPLPFAAGLALADTLRPGEVLKLPADGADTCEYFLLQARGGFDEAPYDAAFPEPRLLILHVDESVPDGAYAGTEPDHLRVRVVEADGDENLAMGDSPGTTADLFPGASETAIWDATSSPDSDAYGGPSGLACEISLTEGGVRVVHTRPAPDLQLDLRVETVGAEMQVAVTVRDTSASATTVSIDVSLPPLPASWGLFAPGVTAVSRDLQPAGDGIWTLAAPIVWWPAVEVPDGAFTTFLVGIDRDGQSDATLSRDWYWSAPTAPLDFGVPLPAGWLTSTNDDAGTRWHVWDDAAAPGLPETSLLACTGTVHADGADWPDVIYTNRADAAILSPPFVADGRVLRVIHALDAHAEEPLTGTDGGQVSVLNDDGRITRLTPVGGYPGDIDSRVDNPLHGQPAFIGPSGLAGGVTPIWRVDIFPLPPDGSPSHRLQLRFAADPLWRGRGWLIARLDLVPAAAGAKPFAAVWDETRGGLALAWPWETPEWITVEASRDLGDAWTVVWEGGVPFGQTAADMLLPEAQMVLAAEDRDGYTLLRARVRIDVGEVVSRTGRLGPPPVPATLGLGVPAPDPFTSRTRFLVESERLAANLGVYDLRGRLVRDWWLGNGRFMMEWDGRDAEGRLVPDGVYILRLSAYRDPRVLTRKVILVR